MRHSRSSKRGRGGGAARLAQARKALRESAARLQRLWESNIIGVMYADAHGNITDANDAVLRMVGYSREDLRAGRVRWTEMTPPEGRARDAQGIAEALERGACTPYEKVYLARDGQPVPILIGYALLDGSRSEYICFVLDQTAPHRAQQALIDHLAIFRTVTDRATSALFMLDQHLCCTFMNPAAELMTGFSFDELRGRLLHDVIHRCRPDGRPYPAEECSIIRSLRDRLGLYMLDEVFVRKSGELFPVTCVASPVLHEGELIAAVLELRDVTAQRGLERERDLLLQCERSARAQAERASRLKDDFVSTLSHELRTPLNVIQGWSRLLNRPERPPDQLAKGLAVIDRNTALLTQLVADILDASRIASGQLSLDLTTVDLPAMVEEALEALRPLADTRGVALHTCIAPGVAPIPGDPGRLKQVVSNLVSNAIKFTPGGGRVDVTLTHAADHVTLVVADTGQGIEPDFLPCAFDRFRQADASTARRHGGLGLGLAIVKHIVDLHGGTVQAQSAGLGAGARFTVELPAAAAISDGAVRVGAARPERADLRGISVLLVEDDPDARYVIQRALEEYGAAVRAAGSAFAALDALVERTPAVVVSDIGMPVMDGYELIRQIRAGRVPAAVDVPAVALTAFARPEDRARALRTGFQEHMIKPFDHAALAAVVARLARPSHAEPRPLVEG